MGALTTRATSVGYGEERAILGSVVKPICADDKSGLWPREKSADVIIRTSCFTIITKLEVFTTYLVVDHHVYCAVCGVGGEVRQVEGLVNDPLACERSITVQQNGHHLRNHSAS